MELFFADYWLKVFDTIASTQDEAKNHHRIAGTGGVDGDKKIVFLSGRQTAGYGRHGRDFLDGSCDKEGNGKNYKNNGGGDNGKNYKNNGGGDNFFLSLYLPRLEVASNQLPSISLLVGICCYDSLVEILPEVLPDKNKLCLKWPNDILLAGKKLGGILIEKIDDAVIIGIGINLHHAPDGFACLAAASDELPTITALAKKILENLDGALPKWQSEGFAAFLPSYQARGLAIGSAIEFTMPQQLQKKSGIYQGVAADGGLQVMVDGVLEKFSVAEVL